MVAGLFDLATVAGLGEKSGEGPPPSKTLRAADAGLKCAPSVLNAAGPLALGRGIVVPPEGVMQQWEQPSSLNRRSGITRLASLR